MLRSVLEGDREAAAELLQVAIAADDMDGAWPAALALGDSDRLVAMVAECWIRQDWERCERIAESLGLQLDAERRSAIDELMDRAHGARFAHPLSRAELLQALARARRLEQGVCFRCSGRGWDAGRDGSTGATLCLAVRLEPQQCLVLGVAAVRGSMTWPHQAWPSLPPWSETDPEVHEAHRAWADADEPGLRIRIPMTPVHPNLAAQPVPNPHGAFATFSPEERFEIALDVQLRSPYPSYARMIEHLDRLPEPARAEAVSVVEQQIIAGRSARQTTYSIRALAADPHPLVRRHCSGIRIRRGDSLDGLDAALANLDRSVELLVFDNLDPVDRVIELLGHPTLAALPIRTFIWEEYKERPSQDSFEALSEAPWTQSLEHLDISGFYFDEFPRFFSNRLCYLVARCPRLRSLHISMTQQFSGSMLADCFETLPALEALHLDHNEHLDCSSLRAIVAGIEKYSTPLTSLDLSFCHKLDAEAAAIVSEAPQLAGLRRLNLSTTAMQSAGAEFLAASGIFRDLVDLDISQNRIEAAGLHALLDHGTLDHVERLDVRLNPLGPGVVRQLLEHGPTQLRELDLSSTEAPDDVLEVVARSLRLGRLERLVLGNSGFTAGARSALLESPTVAPELTVVFGSEAYERMVWRKRRLPFHFTSRYGFPEHAPR